MCIAVKNTEIPSTIAAYCCTNTLFPILYPVSLFMAFTVLPKLKLYQMKCTPKYTSCSGVEQIKNYGVLAIL